MPSNFFDPLSCLLEDELPETGFGFINEAEVNFSELEGNLLSILRKMPGTAPELKSEPGDDNQVFQLDGSAFDFPGNEDSKIDLTFTASSQGDKVAFSLKGPDGTGEACRNALIDILTNASISVDTGSVKTSLDSASVSVAGSRDKEAEAFGEDIKNGMSD